MDGDYWMRLVVERRWLEEANKVAWRAAQGIPRNRERQKGRSCRDSGRGPTGKTGLAVQVTEVVMLAALEENRIRRRLVLGRRPGWDVWEKPGQWRGW